MFPEHIHDISCFIIVTMNYESEIRVHLKFSLSQGMRKSLSRLCPGPWLYNQCLRRLKTLMIAKRKISVRVAERLALPSSDHEVVGWSPTVGGEILFEPNRRFIAQRSS